MTAVAPFFRIILILICSFSIFSCAEVNDKHTEEAATKNTDNNEIISPSCIALYAGSQEEDYLIWIWLYDDGTARVVSGLPLESEADVENLLYRYTDGGFEMTDPSGECVLYTATDTHEGKHNGLPFNYMLNWSHSPGPCWEAYAEEQGWKKEVRLQLVIIDECY